MISSHDKIMAPCIQANTLDEVWTNKSFPDCCTQCDCNEGLCENKRESTAAHKSLRNSDVILINEGQFFPDLYEVVLDMLNNHKKVYICGLDGDFERKKFGAILDLIPLCDKVNKLTSLCSLCRDGTRGIFSMRLTNETEQTLVGSDNYIPVCRSCYSKKQSSNSHE
jgi:thymidine kinase